MKFEDLISEKENWLGGKFRTYERGDSGYKNMTITGMEIKDGAFYLYSGNHMVSASIEYSNTLTVNGRGDEVSFSIPYVGSCYMIRNKSGI